MPDPMELAQTMARISEQTQKLVQDYMGRQNGQTALPGFEITSIMQAFLDAGKRWAENPGKVMEAGMSLWQDYMKLWQNTALRFAGEEKVDPIIAPAQGDRRFHDRAWSESALFDYIKQSYLLSARWLQGMAHETQGLDSKTAHKLDFYTRQFVDAMSPSNFLLTNPEVLRRTMETGGENIVKGLEHLLSDLERGKGQLKIAMVDEKAFEIGANIATTPGKVIYQNDLMQLIQYEPMDTAVYKIPLLIIPPWINKYYILDLGEKKSFVRYLLQQGFQVFMISWVNPDAPLAEKSFDDYMLEGPMAAMAEIAKATGEKNINILGYCLGGTLLACMLAYLGRNLKERLRLPFVNSATYLVTMLDFAESGDLSVFIDEEQLKGMEARMHEQGYLDAQTMATTFNLLRANDLIWSFVINNYLMGKEPLPFDLLYWNSDSTRMPTAMHSFYLREMYQKNNLVKPDGITLNGTRIDLRVIDTPAFFLSTKDDHIAPWRSTYMGTQLMKGPVRFTLSGSGHIAGVVNPPEANKYGYWENDRVPDQPDEWLESAKPHKGSWWPEWVNWLRFYSGEKKPAQPAGATAPVIEDAPGSYVRVKGS